jgi:cob(I)alamin adenosyltransferase
MIHIYTGKGKGKTTAVFGLAMRASGQGLKVIIFQFFKPAKLICGEEISASKLKNIKVLKCEGCHPMFMALGSRLEAQGKTKKVIESMMRKAEKAIYGRKYNVVILDEIINVVDQNFYNKKRFLSLLKKVPQGVELVLTGRGDISQIEDYADYVTIMIDKKHPIRQKIGARRGIEY